ncbi:MAG TPA: hypothetical protein VHY35_02690 [Stellaceae bacterium]|jgi:hypothetical protein|nr:hypothetical protein [Stellaceae bacterium]
MKLEIQVCSLELSQKLHALGVKQESLFWWHHNKRRFVLASSRDRLWTNQERYAAFTVAELDDILKHRLNSVFYLEASDEWVVKASVKAPAQFDPHPAGARAKMLIYLIENQLITV